jgi:iron complex transport system ATP-binding protein
VPAPTARLQVDSLERGEVFLLRGVRWEIGAGEQWVVLGPNGSGKTSLVRILAGYEWPTSGRVEVLGEEFGRTDLRELRKRFGFASAAFGDWFAPSEDALDVVASGFEASVGLWRPPAKEELARAREALDAIGALYLEKRRFGVLSQGERQRVLIARTLVHRPALLILDEPCEGLDPLARERLLADLARLAEAVAQGPVAEVLTADNLGRAFGARCEVRREPGGRWSLRFGLG